MAQLTIDTSSVNCSVHLKRADDTCYEQTNTIHRGHAEHLIDMIDDALATLDISYKDLSRIGVTIGPGSFTGVRVGLSAARGLALALDIPVIGISTLKALAEQHKVASPKLVIIDAKRDEFYTELFAPDGNSFNGPEIHNGNRTCPAEWYEQDQLCLIGSGATHFEKQFPHATILSQEAAPQIAIVAQLCSESRDTDTKPKPLYLRAPDAKPAAANSRIERVPS